MKSKKLKFALVFFVALGAGLALYAKAVEKERLHTRFILSNAISDRDDAKVLSILHDISPEVMKMSDSSFFKPLAHAAFMGLKKNTLEAMVKAGGTVDDKKSKWYPLMGAVYSGNLDNVIFLINKGADTQYRDADNGNGHTAMEVAENFGQIQIVSYFKSLGIKATKPHPKGEYFKNMCLGYIQLKNERKGVPYCKKVADLLVEKKQFSSATWYGLLGGYKPSVIIEMAAKVDLNKHSFVHTNIGHANVLLGKQNEAVDAYYAFIRKRHKDFKLLDDDFAILARLYPDQERQFMKARRETLKTALEANGGVKYSSSLSWPDGGKIETFDPTAVAGLISTGVQSGEIFQNVEVYIAPVLKELFHGAINAEIEVTIQDSIESELVIYTTLFFMTTSTRQKYPSNQTHSILLSDKNDWKSIIKSKHTITTGANMDALGMIKASGSLVGLKNTTTIVSVNIR